jgi:hypothetical protein
MLYPDPHVLGAIASAIGQKRETVAKWLNEEPDDSTPARESRTPPRRPSREELIKRFDKDGDGKLSEEERKAVAALRKAQGARQSDRASDKARPNSGGRERYAAAAMKIKEAVKAGKITEAQGKDRLAAFRKRLGEGRGESDKARPNSGGREGYAAAAKRIKEAVKAGKITEAQGKERLAAYRKRMGEGRGDSGRSGQTREELMKRYDKNKDGKLDEDERAALRKAMSDRNSGKRSPGGDEKNAKRKRPGQGNKKNAERKPRGGDRGKGGEGKRQGKRREKK